MRFALPLPGRSWPRSSAGTGKAAICTCSKPILAGGQYDCLTLLGLEAGSDDVYGAGTQLGSADLNVGNGKLRVFHRFASPNDAVAAKDTQQDLDVVSAYLGASDTAEVIDRTCHLLGLSPQPDKPGPTTRGILTVRLLAKMLARYAFERRGLRYRMGYHDTSGCGGSSLPDLRPFEWALRDNLADRQAPRISDEGRAALCWLLYREGRSAIDDTGPIALIRMDGLMASAVSPSRPVVHRLGPQCLDARLETVDVSGLLGSGRHLRVPGVIQGSTGTAGRQPGKGWSAGSAAIKPFRPGSRCVACRSSDWVRRAVSGYA
jgi:hypothetical protein